MNTSTGTSIMNSVSASVSASASTKAKRVAKKVEETVVVAPVVVAPVVVASPVVASETKRVTKKASASASASASAASTPAVVVSAPVATSVAAAAPVAAAPVATEAPTAPATTLDEDLKSVLSSLTALRDSVSAMITETKRLDKRVHREIKDARKRKRRVRVEGEEGYVKRGPSIFEIPTKVTDELCVFLGHSKGTLISRSNVTKQINNYVKEKNLKNKHDIQPDAALRKLLQVPETEQLTYFNLQRYLNRHYIKEPKVVVVA